MSTPAGPPTDGKVTGLVLADRDGTPLATVPLPAILMTIGAVLPVAVALAAVHSAAPSAAWWPSAVVLLATLGAALFPDSGLGLFALGGLVTWWLAAVDEPSVGSALVVACCGLVLHVVLAHAAAGPAGATPTLDVVRRLAGRCAAVLMATAGVAGTVALAEDGGDPPLAAVVLALVLVAVLPWFAARHQGRP